MEEREISISEYLLSDGGSMVDCSKKDIEVQRNSGIHKRRFFINASSNSDSWISAKPRGTVRRCIEVLRVRWCYSDVG